MKIAVFSDIHGNYEALKVIVEDINKSKFDEVICLGDLIGIGPESKKCLDLVRKSNIELIIGNHELYAYTDIKEDDEKVILNEDEKSYLESCSFKIERIFNNKKFLFEHFLLNDKEYPYMNLSIIEDGKIEKCIRNIDSDYIFIGHQHNAFEINGEKILIDVGSSGCVKDDNTFYTIINIDKDISVEKKYLKYDRDSFIKSIKRRDYPKREYTAKHFFGVELGE